MDEIVWCDSDEDYRVRRSIRPNKYDPVNECSQWYPAGHPELYQMIGMATIISVKPKRRAGFLSNGEEKIEDKADMEVEITPPKKEDDWNY